MYKKKKTVAIILATGGSKGIPSKNTIDFCGKPLLAWSIIQCQDSSLIDEVWVSSDNEDFLEIAESYDSKTLLRPKEFSTDFSI